MSEVESRIPDKLVPVFQSVADQSVIRDYLDQHNADSMSFVWTKTANADLIE